MNPYQDQRLALEQIAETKRIFLATEHALAKKGPITLLISSASQGEGKTLIASALAATAAAMRKYPVLAIDLNWYKPALHRFFELDTTGSLEGYLKAGIAELARPSGQEHLDLLTAPTDYDNHLPHLISSGFNLAQRLVQEATARYELTIIDAASVFPTNRMMMDPVMLGAIVDGVILVVQNATTPRQTVKKSQKIIETAGGNLVGVITNHRRYDTVV